ncbi:hypothetical protein F4804DRAFT_339151 [Jackrogersella minutella]|nr:hypothetical protein F4804DRAFT_339151 [Jackrogersella minutella]
MSSYSSSSHILDSASGPGIVTKILLSPSIAHVPVPGLPISPPPRVQDSEGLSRFKYAEFDAAVMNLGIFALKDPVAGASEMYRVIKPGGHVAATTWKVRQPVEVLQGAVDAIRPKNGLKPMYMTTEQRHHQIK